MSNVLLEISLIEIEGLILKHANAVLGVNRPQGRGSKVKWNITSPSSSYGEDSGRQTDTSIRSASISVPIEYFKGNTSGS